MAKKKEVKWCKRTYNNTYKLEKNCVKCNRKVEITFHTDRISSFFLKYKKKFYCSKCRKLK